MTKKQTVYMGSDTDCHELKKLFKDFLKEKDIPFVDLGVFENDATSFDKIKSELGEKVLQEENPLGVLMFGKNSKL
jgi:ribose 5-phosphate isomerase RpiB